MNYKKLFGYGVLIWAVPYILAMGLYAYGVIGSTWAIILLLIAAAAMAYLAGRWMELGSAIEVLKYSVSWAVIAVVLDMILTVPYTGWGYFSSWSALVTYALIIFAPLLAVKKM